MSWCHTCRVEYPDVRLTCADCGGLCIDQAPPERRFTPAAVARFVVVATLPAEQAFVATGRLDAVGIPSTLRDAAVTDAVHVLVDPDQFDEARSVLHRRPSDPSHTRVLLGVLVVSGVALFLSAVMLVARWLTNGSPLPR